MDVLAIFDQPAVFLDIETDGGSGERGRITEIALIRVENGEVVEEFSSLVNPGGSIPYWITKLTGITNQDVADAPYFDEIAAEVYRILDGAIFVAHNVRFDFSFIKRQLEAAGYRFRPKLFCTVRMSRALYPEYKGHSLEKIITRHAITVADRHRATADAQAILDFTRLAIQEKGIAAFQATAAHQMKTKTLPPNIDETAFAKLPQAPGIYIFEDSDGVPLYVGKSVNIRSRVMSHFANDTKIAKEMKLSLTSHSISFIQTETEIEALLLESAKIKELQPIHNRLLRRSTKQAVLVKSVNEEGYTTISIESRNLNEATEFHSIYGVYTSRMKAKSSLESLMKTFQLCPKLLGLEASKGQCFRSQLGLCKGACVGKESQEFYNRRVEQALERSKIAAWPFKGALSVKISQSKALIVDQWIIKGYLSAVEDSGAQLERLTNGFDMDTYKILRAYLRNHKLDTQLFNEDLLF
ncbi:MAG: exonuclease domain-containing protein [Candidatus Saccharimonadaceae bacterium]